MTMVEVKDDHKVDKAPDDAKFLSDKNRDVDQETRATQTNLDKESDGQSVASKQSDDHTSKEVGGPDDKIRQLEDTKATTDKHLQETDHSGKTDVAKGEIKGEQGDNGDEGTGEIDPNSAFTMRGIDGRGSVTDQGKDGRKAGPQGHARPQHAARPTTTTSASWARRRSTTSARSRRARCRARRASGRRKLDAIKSSLENFVPDVRPGNQTALKTRAHPFALYIARMHRRIHELWGFGFLEDLDNKPADDPLNDPNLWVNLEMSVNADGTVHKVTIAKTSGKTEFDVAAVDTVISAGPYEPTPEAIRSVDGRIYLRWGFYRNWRQCGTFNVEPYILTEVPADSDQGVLDDGQAIENQGKVPGSKHKPSTSDRRQAGHARRRPRQAEGLARLVGHRQGSAVRGEHVGQRVRDRPGRQAGRSCRSRRSTRAARSRRRRPAISRRCTSGLIVESGLPLKDWKLLTPAEYGGGLPDGNVVVQVRTTKETFAVVLTKHDVRRLARHSARALARSRRAFDLQDPRREQALGAGLLLVLDRLPLVQRAEAIAADRRVMDEHVLAVIGTADESVSLRIVEPLHRTERHTTSSLPATSWTRELKHPGADRLNCFLVESDPVVQTFIVIETPESIGVMHITE